MSRLLQSLVCAGAVMLLVCPGFAAVWNQNETIAPIGSTNYDLAVAGGKIHLAYETGGNVYYTARSFASDTWSGPTQIGAGALPSITASPGGAAYVAYTSGADIMEATSAGGWSPSAVSTGLNGSLDLDGAGTRHLLIRGNFDGDGYKEIRYMSNAGAGWSAPTLLHDGWYDSGSGNYYEQTSLAATDSGYVYSVESANWGGKVSWSSKAANAIIPGPDPDVGMGVGYSAGSQLRANAIDAGSSGIAYAFSASGTVYMNSFNGTAWGSFSNLGAGGEASVDTDNGVNVAFVAGGLLKLYDGASNATINFESTDLTGTGPIIEGAGDDLFVLYRDTAGDLRLLSTVPEPATMSLFALGGLAILRRRSRR
ncbi:MAG: PEP-CTERM sorting domain-containing protein [Lentisphaerae bacterium]|nr:PEP-CTERM sorting domain-containing protein [Lentisphaerota bacterium]